MSDLFDELPAHITQTQRILSQFLSQLDEFEKEIVPKIGRTHQSVLIPAQILDSAYTAIETLFLRISQAFGNQLNSNRWHADLLEKMFLELPRIRPRVISQETYIRLEELMRFRHFKRYYLELNYDWRKIDYLINIFREAVPLLDEDLTSFLKKLEQSLGKPGNQDTPLGN